MFCCTPNLMFWKWKHNFKNDFGCIPFLAMEAKSRNQKDVLNCWPYFSCSPFFSKQLTISQPRHLGHQIWCFENKSTFKKCCGLHSFLAMESKSRNQKGSMKLLARLYPCPHFFCQRNKNEWTRIETNQNDSVLKGNEF